METTKTTKAAARLKYQKKQEASWKTWGYKPSRAVEDQYTKQFPCIGSNGEQRLKLLLNSGAFDDFRDPSKPANEQEDVQTLLNAWVEDNDDCRVFKHPKSRAALKHDTKGYEIPPPPSTLNCDWIASDERATLVVDKDGAILAYKFRIPEDLHQKLVESNLFLSRAKRANYSLWAKSTEEISMSSDYRKHIPESENFFEHNRELWNVLDDVLRLLHPVMYKKYTNVDQFLKGDEKRLAGAWHGAIINRQTGSMEEAVPHKNWKDWGKGLTAMIPWGDYEGGDVKLYNLGLRFVMKPCDVLLVNARCVSYGVQEVTKGIRNELDLVVAGTTIKWRHEKVTNGALKRAAERKRIDRERRKAAKQRTPLGRRVIGGGIGCGPRQARPQTVRPPTSTNSNAIPLGIRSNEGENTTKKETGNIRTPVLDTRSSSVTPPVNAPLEAPVGPFSRSSRRQGDMAFAEMKIWTGKDGNAVVVEAAEPPVPAPQGRSSRSAGDKPLVEMKMWTGKDEITASAATTGQKAADVALVNDTAQSPGITAGKESRGSKKREATEKAILDSVPTEGKTAEQIEEDRRSALSAHHHAKNGEERRKNRTNKGVAKAAHHEKALTEGKTAKEIKKALNAENEERRREQAANRKKQKKRERAAAHQRALAEAKDAASAYVEGQGTKRKGKGQHTNTEETVKKQKTCKSSQQTASSPAVKAEVKVGTPSAPKVKSEPAPKRKVTTENVGGKMREVVCLD